MPPSTMTLRNGSSSFADRLHSFDGWDRSCSAISPLTAKQTLHPKHSPGELSSCTLLTEYTFKVMFSGSWSLGGLGCDGLCRKGFVVIHHSCEQERGSLGLGIMKEHLQPYGTNVWINAHADAHSSHQPNNTIIVWLDKLSSRLSTKLVLSHSLN